MKSIKKLRADSGKLRKKLEKDKITTYKKKETKFKKLLEEKNFSAPIKSKKPSKDDVKLIWKSDIPKDYKESIGERKIKAFLIACNIKFSKEVVFEFLKDLRFDFYLPKFRTCIEFDGIQHYQYVDKFDNGDFSKLDKRKINDGRKNKFCKRHNITLIRIPYYKENSIEDILTCKLIG